MQCNIHKRISRIVVNVFCKTGKGGGINPTCKGGQGVGGSTVATSKKVVKPSLTLAETDAVNTWMLNAWGKIKSSQRDGGELGNNFNSALRKMPPVEGESYRGLAVLKDSDMYEVGKTVQFKTSESFSSNKEFASGWAEEHPRVKGSLAEGDREPVVLVMPKTDKIRSLATTQDEVVNLPGMSAKVVKQEVVDGIKYVYFDNPQSGDQATENVFCKTGQGGGIDPTCGTGKSIGAISSSAGPGARGVGVLEPDHTLTGYRKYQYRIDGQKAGDVTTIDKGNGVIRTEKLQVERPFRDQGVAKEMYRQLFKELKSLGFKQVISGQGQSPGGTALWESLMRSGLPITKGTNEVGKESYTMDLSAMN